LNAIKKVVPHNSGSLIRLSKNRQDSKHLYSITLLLIVDTVNNNSFVCTKMGYPEMKKNKNQESVEETLIRKVIKNNANNQKLVTIPKTSVIRDGQYVYIIPVPEYKK